MFRATIGLRMKPSTIESIYFSYCMVSKLFKLFIFIFLFIYFIIRCK